MSICPMSISQHVNVSHISTCQQVNTYRPPSPVSCSAPSSEKRRSPRGTSRTSPSDWLVHFTHQQRSSTIISTTNSSIMSSIMFHFTRQQRSSSSSFVTMTTCAHRLSSAPPIIDHQHHRWYDRGMCSTTNHRSYWPSSSPPQSKWTSVTFYSVVKEGKRCGPTRKLSCNNVSNTLVLRQLYSTPAVAALAHSHMPCNFAPIPQYQR